MGICLEKERMRFTKVQYDDLSREALAYSLYKYAEQKGIKSFRISDLYASDNTIGVYKEFGTNKNVVEKLLRSLNSDANRVLNADLNMGLDHITLRDDLNPIKALSILLNYKI